MDELDRFNEAITRLAVNWKVIFTFVASVFVLGTVLEIARGSTVAWVVISWVVVAALAFLFYFKKGKGTTEQS